MWGDVCRDWERARREFSVFCNSWITCSVCSFRFSLVRLGKVLLVNDSAALLNIVLDREEEREERGEEEERAEEDDREERGEEEERCEEEEREERGEEGTSEGRDVWLVAGTWNG